MNHADMIAKVSEKSGVNSADCQKVLKSFEDVLSDEISNSKDISGALDKAYKVLSFLKNKKR
ncbi:MAG TPA: hypothetical protein DEO65_05010 [Bacillus bacterium]|uniref:Uncharacterized protein n=1 Tax=Siminovitchia fordii TaxID=254759 RepID=A0ABQ4K5M2_9BACI|nr:HU family DNA-binding protein [Siminovitchia fordii]GIN20158.1 hypothetical protein J1TS3_12920 [Siminovitchia fordii]HBZ09234.1 hypothetical protein [Bacillus sp. (in: firmicutes)]